MRLFLQYQKDLPFFLLFFSTETVETGTELVWDSRKTPYTKVGFLDYKRVWLIVNSLVHGVN